MKKSISYTVDPIAVVDVVSEVVSELEPFSLSCLALNLPTPQVSWLKDNAILITNKLMRVSVNCTSLTEYHVLSILTVERAEPGIDNGIYRCRIDNTNTSESVIFDSFNITVEGEC